MSREWKPGDMAMVGGRVCIRSADGAWEHGDERAFAYQDHPDLDVRPLVVIDPEHLEGGAKLPDWLRAHANDIERDSVGPIIRDLRTLADEIERQAFPPKLDEPTGLGAVVEDVDGIRWIRRGQVHWVSPDPHHYNSARTWAEIDAAEVLSEGVTK